MRPNVETANRHLKNIKLKEDRAATLADQIGAVVFAPDSQVSSVRPARSVVRQLDRLLPKLRSEQEAILIAIGICEDLCKADFSVSTAGQEWYRSTEDKPDLSGTCLSPETKIQTVAVVLTEVLTNTQCDNTFDKDLFLKQFISSQSISRGLRLILHKCISDNRNKFESLQELRLALQELLYRRSYLGGEEDSTRRVPILAFIAVVLGLYFYSQCHKVPPSTQHPAGVYVPADRTPYQGQAHSGYKLSLKERSILEKWDIVLVVDRSISMLAPDCPTDEPDFELAAKREGALKEAWTKYHFLTEPFDHPDLVSRWEWVTKELRLFGNDLNTNDISVVSFALKPDIHAHIKSRNAAAVYQSKMPSCCTNLGDAITSAVSLKSKKPIALVVFTDGVPSDAVQPAVVQATRRISQEQLRIVVVTVGRDKAGELSMRELDHNLVNSGAAYDPVTGVPFLRLKDTGLGKVIVNAIENRCEDKTSDANIESSFSDKGRSSGR